VAGLYTRVAGRGLSSPAVSGRTGEAFPGDEGHPVDPAHGVSNGGPSDQTLAGFAPEGPAPVDGTPIITGAWGLPGGVMDDRTPRSHAAPTPPWVGSYESPELAYRNDTSAGIHSADFGALSARMGVVRAEPDITTESYEFEGSNNLAPLDGPARALGRGDRDQGYGWVNGHGFGGGHRDRITHHGQRLMAYLDPAERPFVSPQVRPSFQPSDAVAGPDSAGSMWDGSAINATPPSSYSPPTDPETAMGVPQGAPPSAGWM